MLYFLVHLSHNKENEFGPILHKGWIGPGTIYLNLFAITPVIVPQW